MKARRLYHYIENNWVQSKLMITAAELSGSSKLELTLDLKFEKNGLLKIMKRIALLRFEGLLELINGNRF